ncbi:MAG: 50S ribosomal protein L29 [Candidatus Aenigmarchaeota archaeon]|nr:50S ribosomal protein L29 [Candidatus Aenigmarchaeota archaeon]
MAIERMRKLREAGEKDLKEKLRELRLELSKERASSEIGTVKSPGRVKEIRRTIAKIMTIIQERRGRQLVQRRKADRGGSKR